MIKHLSDGRVDEVNIGKSFCCTVQGSREMKRCIKDRSMLVTCEVCSPRGGLCSRRVEGHPPHRPLVPLECADPVPCLPLPQHRVSIWTTISNSIRQFPQWLNTLIINKSVLKKLHLKYHNLKTWYCHLLFIVYTSI